MRKLIAWILGWQVVWLRDHDGEVVRRLAQPCPFGGLIAYRMSRLFRISKVSLLPDGRVKGAFYVEEWRPDSAPREQEKT